jgi:hypothetical protein
MNLLPLLAIVTFATLATAESEMGATITFGSFLHRFSHEQHSKDSSPHAGLWFH